MENSVGKKILIVSDFPVGTLGGAQSIIGVINKASKQFQIEIAKFPGKANRDIQDSNAKLLGSIKGLINPLSLIGLTYQVVRKRPDVIWFHNVNNHWSWSSLLVPGLGAIKMITLHDLTALSNYKIVKNSAWDFTNLEYAPISTKVRIRNWFIRKFLSRVRTVGIGDICVQLLRMHRVRVDFVISNRIEPCSHKKKFPKLPKTVLFAGRQNLKGLNIIAKSVAESQGWRLIIAGTEDAYNEAKELCDPSKITYLGVLPREELLEVIHKVELVSVCSQYYDNFPTIGLEALVHDSLPITTNLTGIASLLKKISNELVLNDGEYPMLDEIKSLNSTQTKMKEKVILEITDLNTFMSEYLEVMK